MLKALVSGIAAMILISPAFAAEYWIVLDPSTNKCVVVQQKPAQPVIKHSFNDRATAESVIDRAVACGGPD